MKNNNSESGNVIAPIMWGVSLIAGMVFATATASTGLSPIDEEMRSAQCDQGLHVHTQPVAWVGYDPDAIFFSKPRPCPGYEGTFTALYDGVGDVFRVEWHGPGPAPQLHPNHEERTRTLMHMALSSTT